MKKKYLKLMAVVMMFTALVGCGSKPANKSELELIKERGVLKVGTEGTYSPNSYHDENGDLVGFDVEVARLVGKHLGVDVEFVEAEWDSLFAAMDSGRIDTVINEVEYSKERELKYDLSSPYTYIHGALLVPNGSDIQSFDQIKGKRAAQNLTSTWGAKAESYGATLVSVDTMDMVMSLLDSSRADMTLNAETAFADYIKSHPEANVTVVDLTEETTSSVIPIKKGNEELVLAINEALEKMQTSGELSALSMKYFGIDVTNK